MRITEFLASGTEINSNVLEGAAWHARDEDVDIKVNHMGFYLSKNGRTEFISWEAAAAEQAWHATIERLVGYSKEIEEYEHAL